MSRSEASQHECMLTAWAVPPSRPEVMHLPFAPGGTAMR
ncbi:hypothetical protein LC55x_3581 [Lysobacter capsici]|nr:hypothetical protein LC55x_3581 [Lysobacter capsici]